jgi:3-carboxy-cis,cis-muconate cycloisomerase
MLYGCDSIRVPPMTDPISPSPLLSPLFSSAAMRAIVSDPARLQRMLAFEAALARSEAALGAIPASAAEPIVQACRSELYDVAALGAAAAAAGNVAIPLVQALTEEVAKSSADAARYVHWGATSQDVIDTASVLELREAIDALMADLDRAIEGFATLAGRHRRTPAVARTFLQHALPMPFGLKMAGNAAALARSRDRLRRLRKDALVLQFGGAAGTLAALGEQGLAVSERLGLLLDLPVPEAPWHSHRDRIAEVASALAVLAGTCGKIARDVALMMQTDVAEASEPAAPGRGGSSSMPHKRNPVLSAAALAAATMAPNLTATILAAQVQEHERALGGWQAEWATFPALLLVTSGGLAAIAEISQGLEVDGERMRASVETTRGQVMAEAVSLALGAKIGKAEAHALIAEACRKASAEKRHLQEILAADERVTAHLAVEELGKLFDPTHYQGVAQMFIERLVAPLQSRGSRRL